MKNMESCLLKYGRACIVVGRACVILCRKNGLSVCNMLVVVVMSRIGWNL